MAHVTFPKPARGTALLERRAKRRALDAHEKAEKAAVMVRDGRQCRWPRCEYRTMRIPIEVAHVLGHKALGGNPANDRSQRNRMAAMCKLHHQGATSLHSGDLRIEPLTQGLLDGPCAFYEKSDTGRWDCVGVERTIGVSETRGL